MSEPAGNARSDRARWWLWRRLIKLPGVCPATAHSRIIGRYRDQSIKVDGVCRSDLARNGNCWCGKFQANPQPPLDGEP